jgi:DNA repair protein RecN (Recombination protein N)
MLREIKIQNLAIVEDASIPFSVGLNVLTGSTGAGKSIILTAVELLSGARGRRSLVRSGAPALTVEGVFSVDAGWPLRERLGMGAADAELSIRRELAADGRSRVWINGMASTVAACQEASDFLFELHGQHRQQEFLDPANHISFLDAYGDYGELLGSARKEIERFRGLSARIRELRASLDENRRQEEFLRFQLRELEDLKLEPGLDKMLESKVRRLTQRSKYLSALSEARSLLESDGAALEKLQRAERLLQSIASIDPVWQESAGELAASRISAQEVSRRVELAIGEAEEMEDDLEALQERLAAIQRAGRKHGLDCAGLIEKRDGLRRTVAGLENGSGDIGAAERGLAEARGILVPLLRELGERRRASAAELDRNVTAGLQQLGMKGALFETAVESPQNSAFQQDELEIHLTAGGWDRVEFRIRTNVGEDLHPLAEIASGGELSRITLVLKQLQVEEKRIPTLIFDEIDSGLGADLGGVVAQRLAELASTYQIVCITHLPQVAARASRHVKVSKQVKGDRTIASAQVLSGPERVGEIARMLGGKGKLEEELAATLLENGSAPVAQLDRAPASGAGCRRFKSSRARSS